MKSILKLISFLVRFSGRDRRAGWTVVWVIASSVTSGLASIALLALINSALNRSGSMAGSLTWIFVALAVFLPVGRFLSTFTLSRLTAGVVHDLRIDLSRRILAVPLRRLEQLGPERLLATLTTDVGAITAGLAAVPSICMYSTIVIGCLVYQSWLSRPLFLLVLGFLLVGVVGYQLPILRGQRYLEKCREEWDTLFEHFRGLIHGAKELKIHNRRRHAFLQDHLEITLSSLRDNGIRSRLFYGAASSWGQGIVFIVIGLILFLSPRFDQVSREALTGYVLVILYMTGPLDALLNLLSTLGNTLISLNKVEELGALPREQSSGEVGEGEAHRRPTWERLELAQVTHTYSHQGSDDLFTLGPLDLTFRPGQLVFLVGGNGSGKTTFAKLLLGLYTPAAGHVLLDGEVVEADGLEAYRNMFSVVFNDFFLFKDLLGLDGPGVGERSRQYLRKLQLEGKVRIENAALSTLDLSQGQRKRLALLTAYLEDRDVYLFDEWAADQDPHFKEIFYLELLPDLKARGKTVFVISHDDGYYHVADRIIKFNNGQPEYDGPAAEYLHMRRDEAVPGVALSGIDRVASPPG